MDHPLPVLMGPRVRLREPARQDAVRLFDYASDPQVTRYLAFDTPRTVGDLLAFIAICEQWRRQDREYVFLIADRATDEAIGVIGLRHLDTVLGTAQIGTWVRRASWGTGANREAKGLLLDFAFRTLGLHRIEARIASDNERSRRAFERLGAAHEGTLRESFRKNGLVLDQELYAILAPDWTARRLRGAAPAATRHSHD